MDQVILADRDGNEYVRHVNASDAVGAWQAAWREVRMGHCLRIISVGGRRREQTPYWKFPQRPNGAPPIAVAELQWQLHSLAHHGDPDPVRRRRLQAKLDLLLRALAPPKRTPVSAQIAAL